MLQTVIVIFLDRYYEESYWFHNIFFHFYRHIQGLAEVYFDLHDWGCSIDNG